MIKIKTKSSYLIIALLLFFCISLMFIGNSHAFSSSILYFSIVHITNTQNISTSQPFQQRVNLTINSTNSKYINQTGKYSFQNVEFFNTTNGSVIDSWLENYTSKYAIFWIKLPNGIPANTTLTDIAIGFASNTTNLFNNKTTGEAPQLSSTYAEYDNGANIFYAYFNANTPKSDFNLNSAISFSTTTYNSINAIQLTGSTATRNGIMTYEKPLTNQAYLEFAYFAAPSTSDNNGEPSVGLGNSATATSIGYYGGDNPSSTAYFGVQGVSDGTWGENTLGTGTTQWQIDNFTYVPASSNVNGCEMSPQVYCDTYTNELTSQSTLYLSFFFADGDGTPLDALYNWVLVSSYPPNRVMPSITVGSVENLTYVLSLNGSFNSNSTITYGTESNFTGLSRNSSVFVRLFINNTKVTNYSKNSTSYLRYLAAGLYKVTAQYNSTAVKNITYYERIKKAIPSIQLYSLPSKNYTQNGTYLRFNFSISSLNNQLTGRFYLNKTNKVNTSTAADYNVSNLPNTYTAVFNTTGNQNYTINSMNLTRRIYPISLYLNGVLNSNSTITYGTESNFTADLPLEYVRLFINNTKVTNYSKNSTTYTKILAAGLYEITANTNSSGGENVSFYEKINKAVPSLSIESSTGNFTYDGDPLNLTGVISTSYNQLSANEYINGKLFASTNTRKSYLNATAGTYKIIFNTTGNQNYTSYSTSKEIVISKASPSYTLSGQSFIYDGKTTNISATVNTVNNQLSATLYIDGAVFSSFTKDSSIYKNATAGSYSAEVSSNGNENYSSFSYSETFIISKAEPTMECTDSPLVFLYNGSYFNLTCNLFSINNQLLGKLYLNNLTINSSKSKVSYRNNKTGEYIFIFKAGNENYSEKEINTSNSILGNLSFNSPLIKYYSPLIVSNYQQVSTPQPFQQMVNVSHSLYKGYAASNFQNVEFFYSNGTIIPSWLEGYNYSRNAIYWLKIGSMPASSSITIYMGFALNSTNLFNNKTIGEAPQLSSTYAEYDDGANVFSVYYNFAGTTLPSGWTSSGTITVNNGLSISGSSATSDAETTVTYRTSVLDWYGYTTVPTGSGYWTNLGWYSGSASTAQGNNWFTYSGQSDYGYGYVTSSSVPVITYTSTVAGSSPNYVFSIANNGATAYYSLNYNQQGTTYSMQTATNYIAFRNGAGSSGRGANIFVQWVRTRAYPPNGVMPSITFSKVYSVPILMINGSSANFTGIYGTKIDLAGYKYNTSNSIRLLINNKNVTSYKNSNETYSNFISAGINKITIEENLSNSSNYIKLSYYVNLSKRMLLQKLIVYPASNFTYSGNPPIIEDKINESIVPGNSLKLELINSSNNVSRISTSSNVSNFSLSGKYATAGKYSYSLVATSNQNYTIYSSSVVNISINKAVPILVINTAPTLNYSNNGTSLIFHFIISSVDNQLLGNFYINNTIENSSIVNGTYNASYQPNTFIAKLNTSGDENYTSKSIQKTMEIKLGKLYLYLNGFQSNLTVTYPQPLNVSAYSIPSTLPIKLYINNTLTASSNGSLHYLKYMAAGLYKITVATNSSGIANVSFYQRINKAVPKLVLYPYYYSQIYNGSGIPINLNISSVNNQLFYQLYVNSSISFTDDSNVTYTTNASAGLYRIKLYSPGNQNYSGIVLNTILKIEKAKPVLTLLLNPDKSFYYNGTPFSLHGIVYSFNDQLSANLYINNILKGKGYKINYSSSIPIEYKIVLETLGNDNYSAAFENFNLTIMNLTGKELLTSKTKLFNQSVLNTVFNVSRLNYKEQATAFRLFPAYNLSIPLPYNITPVTELSMPVLSNLNESVFTISYTKNYSCFGNSLSSILYSFNDSVNVNEGNFGEVTYLFSLHKNVLLADNLSAADISLYRCSTTKHNWQEIPTFLVDENDTSANYKAVSPGFSQYVIAEGPSLLSTENSSLTIEYVYENGLPADYRWNATINNVTLQSTSGSPILTLIPYGQFKIKFYNLSSYASNATYSCKITYLPNIPQNSSLLGIAGIPIVVNYSVSEGCLPNHKSAVYNFFIEFRYEIIAAVILIVALVSFMFFYTKRKAGNKKDYKKKRNKQHVNRRVTKQNNRR